MTPKQKYVYTALGAFILLIGILIGAIVSQPLIAQTATPRGDIECTSLTVLDSQGTPVIVLRSDETLGNGIILHNPAGAPAVLFVADGTSNSLALADAAGEPAVLLRTSELANRVIIHNPAGKEGVRLSAGKVANRVTVHNPEGANAVQLYADEVDNRVTIHDYGIIRWQAP